MFQRPRGGKINKNMISVQAYIFLSLLLFVIHFLQPEHGTFVPHYILETCTCETRDAKLYNSGA